MTQHHRHVATPPDPSIIPWHVVDDLKVPQQEASSDLVDTSDDSWTAEDVGDWQTRYHEELTCFEADDSRSTFLTGLLNFRQRNAIHTMAHIRRMSHMSLGLGKSKRILISKPDIIPFTHQKGCRNMARPGRYYHMAINPRLVTYQSTSISDPSTLTTLHESLIQRLLELGAYTSSAIVSPYPHPLRCKLRVRFYDPAHAALAVSALPDCFKYVCRPLAMASLCADVHVQEPRPTSGEVFPFDRSCANPRIKLDPIKSGKPCCDVAFRSHSSPSGYASSSSSNTSRGSEMCAEDGAERKAYKRKRLPPGEYECTFDGCNKSFSLAGHRTKHEKVHQREQWQHQCDECEHIFQFRKDLKRHFNNTGHANDVKHVTR